MGKTDKAAASEAVKAPRVRLTREARYAIFKAAGGRCFVFGLELDPLGDWHVEDGVLLSPAAKKLKRGRTLEELRVAILKGLADTQSEAERLRRQHEVAEHNYNAVKAALGPLVEGNKVRFAGEHHGTRANPPHPHPPDSRNRGPKHVPPVGPRVHPQWRP